MRKKLYLGLFIVLLFPIAILGLADKTFSGTGDKNTAPFDCQGQCKITWTTTYEPDVKDYAMFAVFVYPVGESALYVSEFSGLEGTTYLYEKGTFYFSVITANLKNWEIHMEEKAVSEFSAAAPLGALFLATALIALIRHKKPN